MSKKKFFFGEKSWGQVQIGTSSLVLILTVLALTLFSTLALASAQSDLLLAEKNRQAVMNYYQADGKAEMMLRDFEQNPGQVPVAFQVEAGQDQFLSVMLKPLGKTDAKENDRHYRIASWRVVNKVDVEIYDDLPVWDGSEIL